MNGRTLLAGLLGGIVLFMWLGISWAALPFHMNVYHGVTYSAEMDSLLKQMDLKPGLNYYPAQIEDMSGPEHMEFVRDKPVMGVVSYMPTGESMNVGKTMMLGLVGCIIAAILVAMFLSALPAGATFGGKVLFCAMFGVAAFFCTQWMTGQFFYYPVSHMLLELIDGVVGWSLAGLVLAGMVRSAVPHPAKAA